MQEPDPAGTPAEPGGGPAEPVAGPDQAPVLRTELRQNSLGRSGSFPKAFARVHPVHKTPVMAIFAQLCLALGSGLLFGAWFGADVSFFFVGGAGTVDPQRGRGARRERGGVREGGGRPDMILPAVHA
jgi:hypothetical protein